MLRVRVIERLSRPCRLRLRRGLLGLRTRLEIGGGDGVKW